MPNNSERKVYHVTHNGDKGWKVKREGAARASDYFDNKSDAVERGRELAQSGDKGQIIIHKKDGSFQTEHTYKNDPYPPKG
jgi:uncharacterized protein YdaT